MGEESLHESSFFGALTQLGLDVLDDCCKGADEGEIDEVYRLVHHAESHRNQLTACHSTR